MKTGKERTLVPVAMMHFRQVHLDFHTSEKIEKIGFAFDKKEFQQALIDGHVDSITLFSKCHHGWSYHPTKTNQMHPHLDFDLFGAQIEAALEIGVNVAGYISAGHDEKYAVEHPECLARYRDERIIGRNDLSKAGYHLLCFNSPYLDVLAAQVTEVCRNYPISRILLDIAKPTPCYCRNCVRAMEREGLDPDNEADVYAMAQKTYAKYTAAMWRAVDAVDPKLTIYHNGGETPRGRRDILDMNSHLEIESLPTGGWGYDNFPMIARYVQPMGKEYLGMTGKFHLSWGEFGGYKHENALIYETSLNIMNGGKCSIGDQLHPDGRMDAHTYRIIGRAFEKIEKKEPWLDGVTAVADIGLLSYDAWLSCHPSEKGKDEDYALSDIGALRILMEGHYLFDVLDLESDFAPYKLLILPDNVKIGGALKSKLDAYVAGGGKLLASGCSGLAMHDDGSVTDFAYDLGVSYVGARAFKPAYLAVEKKLGGIEEAGYVLYADTQQVKKNEDGTELAAMHAPYFSRSIKHFCSHLHAPEKKEYDGVGMGEGKHGIYLANAAFREYATVGSFIAKQMVMEALDRLLGETKTVEVVLPSQAVVTLMEQREQFRSVLHMLYAPRTMKGTKKIEIIEDCVPLHQIEVALRVGDRTVDRVYSAPDCTDLSYTVDDAGVLRFVVPKIEIHGMTVIEWKK